MNSTHNLGFLVEPWFARGFPFLLFITLLILGQNFSAPSFGKDFNDFGPWLAVARGPIVALLLVWFWKQYSELRDYGQVMALRWVEGALVGVIVFLLWIYLDKDWAVLSRSAGFDPRLADGRINWPVALLRLAGLALVVPVMEELFWRSLVLRWIESHDFLSEDPRKIGLRAFLITSTLFALEHEQWLAGALAGMAYNGLYMRSGNLWVPILSHVTTNGALGIWVLYTGNWQFW